MSTKPDTNPNPNPDHDAHAAGLYQAIALRFYRRYADARRHAEFRGEDLPDAEPLPTEREVGERYERVVDEWIWEPPATLDAVCALVEFANVVAADRVVAVALREQDPDETDAFHQTIALGAAAAWLDRAARDEWLDRRVAAYGPGGMSAKEKERDRGDAA
jgi:hypothetical protein